MRTRMLSLMVLTLLGSTLAMVFAQQPTPAGRPGAVNDEDLRKAVQAYAAAFNKGDVEAVMAFWTPDPEFVDDTGKLTRGREAIAALFKETFTESKGVTLKLGVKAIKFLKPDVAIQDGQATLTTPDGVAETGAYTAIWLKNDGKWLLSRIQDVASETTAGATYEQLKQLDWLTGDWTSEGKSTLVTFNCKWTKNQCFLMIEQTIHLQNQEAMTITQMIGWDPLQQQIRSWVFDSRGGFGEGLWTRTGNNWAVDSAGVLADGRRATSVSSWKYVNDNICEWTSVDRQIDSQPAPDITVKYVRKTDKK